MHPFIPKFEKVLVEGFCRGVWDSRRYVPVRPGKLHKTILTSILGYSINTDIPLVVDYYGYLKKSEGFFEEARQLSKDYSGSQLKLIEVPIVFFASLKVEDVATVSGDHVFVGQFVALKQYLINLRGFRTKRELNNV